MNDLFFQPQAVTKMTVEKLTLAEQVPPDCDVYAFYVPGMLKFEDLEKALLDYGKDAGKTIFVGKWAKDSPIYKGVINAFEIKGGPVVVVTAKSIFSANPQDKTEIAFAKIDNQNLFADLPRASNCITETINLYLQGKVKEAMINAKLDGYGASWYKYFKGLKGDIAGFLKDHSVTFDVLKGQIIVAPSPPPSDDKKEKDGKKKKQ